MQNANIEQPIHQAIQDILKSRKNEMGKRQIRTLSDDVLQEIKNWLPSKEQSEVLYELFVKEEAYKIWLEEGKPEGRDKEHWFKAIDRLKGWQNIEVSLQPIMGIEKIASDMVELEPSFFIDENQDLRKAIDEYTLDDI